MIPDKSSTASASSLDRLTGKTVRLWPYVPGVYGRDALYRVWKMMEDDGGTRQAFWDETDPETGGDLASFIKAFDGTKNRLLLMVEGLDAKQLIGCIWFAEIAVGHQAFGSIWMHKMARGQRTLEACSLALRHAFESFQLRQVWSITPWPTAGMLCERLGYREVTRLPDFCKRGEDFLDVMIYRVTKEQCDGIYIQERQ